MIPQSHNLRPTHTMIQVIHNMILRKLCINLIYTIWIIVITLFLPTFYIFKNICFPWQFICTRICIISLQRSLNCLKLSCNNHLASNLKERYLPVYFLGSNLRRFGPCKQILHSCINWSMLICHCSIQSFRDSSYTCRLLYK